jgi:hypothetical protein
VVARRHVCGAGLIFRHAQSVTSDGVMFRYRTGKPQKNGATPEHCHLFDSAGKAFQRKIVEVLAA